MDKLNGWANGAVDTEFAACLVFDCVEGSETAVKECLDKVLTDSSYAGGLCREIRPMIE